MPDKWIHLAHLCLDLPGFASDFDFDLSCQNTPPHSWLCLTLSILLPSLPIEVCSWVPSPLPFFPAHSKCVCSRILSMCGTWPDWDSNATWGCKSISLSIFSPDCKQSRHVLLYHMLDCLLSLTKEVSGPVSPLISHQRDGGGDGTRSSRLQSGSDLPCPGPVWHAVWIVVPGSNNNNNNNILRCAQFQKCWSGCCTHQ